MKGYECVRDRLRKEEGTSFALDEAQLIKHAFALRTQVHRDERNLRPILYYVYAESDVIPGDGPECGTPIDDKAKAKHQDEIAAFAEAVRDNEVRFVFCTYGEMLEGWRQNGAEDVRKHAENVMRCFAP